MDGRFSNKGWYVPTAQRKEMDRYEPLGDDATFVLLDSVTCALTPSLKEDLVSG